VAAAIGRFFSFLFEDIMPPVVDTGPRLPEDRIPVDKKGKRDLSFYTEPVTHYIDLYNASLAVRQKGWAREQDALAWKQRVHGIWGLSAKGQEALPYILTMIRHPNPDAREDGYFLLAELKGDAATGEQLLECLQSETDLVALSSLISALGKCRYRPAIPALRSLILDTDVDVDTRWDAADSVGTIVGVDFSGPDKLEKAEAWFASQEQRPDA
jgi:hypothetical protein